MRLRNPKNKDEILKNSKILLDSSKPLCLKEIFQNDNEINLEIGMGKGDFILQMAQKYPNKNFVGVEKFDGVICKAIKKLEEYNLLNIRLIRSDAVDLEKIINKEINTIYLNFSDPWLKKRYHKRRLTHINQLKTYDKLFKNKKHIIFKTDNIELFNDSILYLEEYGYKIIKISYDLHNENLENFETEYEKKFSNLGFKINYLEAIKK